MAVLSYCKFMCISQKYCEANISKIMKILYKPETCAIVKNNIVIAIGDLLHRFPNTVEK